MASVSVVVPVYNAERWLERCVDSILAQTLEDIEIILVDDGSTDASPGMCDAYAQKHGGKVRVYHQTNKGQSAARNFAMSVATGEYIGFVDNDDYILPGMYKAMYEAARAHDADVVKCGFQYVDNAHFHPPYPKTWSEVEAATKDLPPEQNPVFRFKDETIGGREFLHNIILGQLDSSVWCLIVRKAITKGLQFNRSRYLEDALYCVQLAGMDLRFHTLSECFYVYLQRPDSAIRTRKAKEFIDLALLYKLAYEKAGVFRMEDVQNQAYLLAAARYRYALKLDWDKKDKNLRKNMDTARKFLESQPEMYRAVM